MCFVCGHERGERDYWAATMKTELFRVCPGSARSFTHAILPTILFPPKKASSQWIPIQTGTLTVAQVDIIQTDTIHVESRFEESTHVDPPWMHYITKHGETGAGSISTARRSPSSF